MRISTSIGYMGKVRIENTFMSLKDRSFTSKLGRFFSFRMLRVKMQDFKICSTV